MEGVSRCHPVVTGCDIRTDGLLILCRRVTASKSRPLADLGCMYTFVEEKHLLAFLLLAMLRLVRMLQTYAMDISGKKYDKGDLRATSPSRLIVSLLRIP